MRLSKGRRMRDQIANIHWIIEKPREFQKNISFFDYTKALTAWIKANWEILRNGNIRQPDLSPEKPVRRRGSNSYTGHGTMGWFTIGKEHIKDVYCQPAYLAYMPGEISTISDIKMTPL